MSASKRNVGALAVLAVIAAPLVTVDEDEAKRFHGAVHAAGFYDAAPGKLYEYVGLEGARQGGYPLCGFVSTDGATPAPTVTDRSFRGYYNRLGSYLPIEAVLEVLFAEGAHPRTSLPLETQERTLDKALRPGPGPECEARATVAQQRGNVVCVVDSVVMRDGQPWAIRFNPYAFFMASMEVAVACPLAENGDLFWRIKGPLVSATLASSG